MNIIDVPADPLKTDVWLSDVLEDGSTWDRRKSQSQDIAKIYLNASAKYHSLGKRMSGCSTELLFSIRKNPEKKLRLTHARFCQSRHCPVCQWRRSLRHFRRVFERLPALQAQMPNLRWMFLTLTVRNPEMSDLRNTLLKMSRGWQRLIQRVTWPAVGWIRTVEITKGQDGRPHPHYHALLAIRPGYYSGKYYVKHSQWVELWRDCMRLDYDPVVDIRTVQPKDGTLYKGIVETLKYAVKPEDMLDDPDFLLGLTDQIKSLRFLASGGILKGWLKEALSSEEMLDDQGGEDQDRPEGYLLARWRNDRRRYAVTHRLRPDFLSDPVTETRPPPGGGGGGVSVHDPPASTGSNFVV